MSKISVLPPVKKPSKDEALATLLLSYGLYGIVATDTSLTEATECPSVSDAG